MLGEKTDKHGNRQTKKEYVTIERRLTKETNNLLDKEFKVVINLKNTVKKNNTWTKNMQEGFSSTLRDSEKDTSYLEDRVEAQPKQSSKKKKKLKVKIL